MPNWYEETKDSTVDSILEARYIFNIEADLVVPASDPDREIDSAVQVLIKALGVAEKAAGMHGLNTTIGDHVKVEK